MRVSTPWLLMLGAMLIGCGGGTTVLATTPTPGAAAEAGDLPAPAGRWEIDLPDVEWTPTMIGGDQGAMLGRALADRRAVALVIGRGMRGAEVEDQVFQMIKGVAPETAVVARARGTLDRLLEERGEIPYRVTMEPAGTDVLGRPYYLPKEHPLNTEWLERKSALKGADALLTVRRIDVGATTLRQLREQRRGDCTEIEQAVGDNLARGAAFFAPHLEAVDVELAEEFERQLSEALPFWRREIETTRGQVDPGSAEIGCLDAYAEMLDGYAPCLERECANAPRAHAVAGGVIGIDLAPLTRLPDRCPSGVMRDYGAEIEALAARSVAAVLPRLGRAWPGELVRYGAFQRAADGLADHCKARHRRVSEDGAVAGREALGTFVAQLRDSDVGGEWEMASGQERVAGIGPIMVLARTRPVGPDPGIEAAALLERWRSLDRCAVGGERLVQAALIDVGSSEVVFMGIFFEEQLLCEGLPPGQP